MDSIQRVGKRHRDGERSEWSEPSHDETRSFLTSINTCLSSLSSNILDFTLTTSSKIPSTVAHWSASLQRFLRKIVQLHFISCRACNNFVCLSDLASCLAGSNERPSDTIEIKERMGTVF